MLKIYCINLDRRTDRWAQLQDSCARSGLPPALVERLSACEDADFGALGCAKSHVAALARFLTQETAPYCLVLEDDFELVRPWGDLVERFNKLPAHNVDWDVLLLTGTAVVALPATPAGVARVIEAQSAAAYLVSRRYAATLLSCFVESIAPMEMLRAVQPRPYLTNPLCVDQAWKRLQRQDRWFIFSPAMGRQRPSFSDIEKRETDYEDLTYGLAEAAGAAS